MKRNNALVFATGVFPNRRELRSLMSHQTRKPALPEGIPLSTYSAAGIGHLRPRRSILPMPGMSIWRAHECFTARRSSFSCYGLFGERQTPFSLPPAKPGDITQRDNSSPAQARDRTENSGQGCHGLNPALKRQAVWSSTASRISAGAHQPTSQKGCRHGRRRSSSDRPSIGREEEPVHGGCRTSMSWNRSWIAARTARRCHMDILQ